MDVLERLNQVAGELEVMTRRTEALYRHNAAVINDTLGSGGQDLKRLLDESHTLFRSLRRLIRELEANPAMLVTQPAPRGVEIAP